MRGWHELVATLGDWMPGGVLGLAMALLILVIIVALLWYWFPEWARGLVAAVRRLGRAIAGMRFPWRRRRHRGEPERGSEPERKPDVAVGEEELPDVPAAALAVSADELAAQGRYKEAVRERLRAIVRDLVERGVVENRLGWTVTELANMAGRARPATAAPLGWASAIFSSIWYGQRDATAADDAAMREHAGQVRAALAAGAERAPAWM